MTTSIASVPKSSASVTSTGPGNWVEVAKFIRLCAIWIGLIFGPVWMVSWGVGELIPYLLIQSVAQSPEGLAQVQPLVDTLQFFVPLLAVMIFIPINAMFMVLCERRGLALFTVRKGPNRVGFDGLAQTFADALKLLFKEDITPKGADILLFTLAPIVFFAPSIFGAVPLLSAVTYNHPLFLTCNLPTGIFYVLAMGSIPVVALVMAGWSSNNKYSLVGGLRSAAQAISYEIPLVLSLITVCFLMGTLNVADIGANQSVHRGTDELKRLEAVQSVPPQFVFVKNPETPEAPKSAGILHWNMLGNVPFHLSEPQIAGATESGESSTSRLLAGLALALCSIALLGIYMTGACAEINRIPFDLPEAESELVSGYNTEYSGIKFAIFFLAEFTNLFIVSTVATVMFLGGGSSPIPGLLDPYFFQQVFYGIGSVLGNLGLNTGIWTILGTVPLLGGLLSWIGSVLVNLGLNPGILTFFGSINPVTILGTMLNPVTFSGWLWVVAKVYGFVFLAILVRGTLPRFRIDQLLNFGWKRLIPISLILFLVVTFLKEIIRV